MSLLSQFKQKITNEFFSKNGRIGRLDYFVSGIKCTLYILLFLIPAVMLYILLCTILNKYNIQSSACDYIFIFYVASLAVAMICADFSLSAKRMHDLGLSAWFLLPWFLLPIIIPVASLVAGMILLFYPGSKKDNKYGPTLRTNKNNSVIDNTTGVKLSIFC